MAMKQALPIAGIGAGMMQGLELHRRHQREDEDVAMRRDQMDMNRESHALNMDSGRLNLDFARETNPLRRQSMEQGVELGALQLEDTRDALPYNQRQRRRQDDLGIIQLDQAQKQQASHVAVNALRMNDWAGFNTAMDQLFPGRMVFMPGDNGEIFAEETDEEGNSEIFTFQPDELMRNITLMGSPQASAQNAMDQGAYVDEVDPVLGAGQRHRDTGQFTQMQMGGKKPKGGAGGGVNDSQALTYMEKVLSKQYGSLSADGQFIVPEGNQARYVEAQRRAEKLYNMGMDPGEAAYVAGLSVDKPLTSAKAQQIAENEANEQGLSWGEKSKFVQDRSAQLIEDSKVAANYYAKLVGEEEGYFGANSAPAAGLTLSAPGQAATGSPAPAAPTPAPSAPAPAPSAAPVTAPAPAQIPTINSQAEYDSLPSGAEFINPADGQTYKKP